MTLATIMNIYWRAPLFWILAPATGVGLFGNNAIILRNVALRHATPDQVVRSFQLRNVC